MGTATGHTGEKSPRYTPSLHTHQVVSILIEGTTMMGQRVMDNVE